MQSARIDMYGKPAQVSHKILLRQNLSGNADKVALRFHGKVRVAPAVAGNHKHRFFVFLRVVKQKHFRLYDIFDFLFFMDTD